MDITIKEVTTKNDLKKFIRFPHKIHKGDSAWVPALDFDEMNNLHWDKNAAFEHCQARYLLAYKNGEIVGRIAAIYNKLHIETWNQRYLRFGWIDFIDDAEVIDALMGEVESWAKKLKPSAGNAVVAASSKDGKTFYRVRIVGLADRAAARKVAGQLESSYKLPPLWVGSD